MIILSGDTHGSLDIEKLMPELFPFKDLTKEDYVIILGDFVGLFKNGIKGNLRDRLNLIWAMKIL